MLIKDVKIKGYTIDDSLFNQKFVDKCDIAKCCGECCYYGVYFSLTEYKKIWEIKEKLVEIFDETQTKDFNKWFEEPVEDNDFPEGVAIGSEVYNGKCVFLDKQGFCSLQKFAIEEGKNKWHYKPLYCILFPIAIYEGSLLVDDYHLSRMHYCSKIENQQSTVIETCKEELIYLLGLEGYRDLLNLKDEYFEKIYKGEEIES
jgi:hypothetical protein